MATPDWDSSLSEAWGWGVESIGALALFGAAANVLIGTNPPFYAQDFLAMYPAFGGALTAASGTFDGTTAILTAPSSLTGLAVGQPVIGAAIPDGTTILSLASGDITLSNIPTGAAGVISFSVYTALLVPVVILNAYIALATSCLQQARYCELWTFVMGLFIAHYLTLWLWSQASTPNATAGQVATAGLAMIIKTSKSAGDVSTSGIALDFGGWGAYQLTQYGQQFLTFAQPIGSGNMLIY